MAIEPQPLPPELPGPGDDLPPAEMPTTPSDPAPIPTSPPLPAIGREPAPL